MTVLEVSYPSNFVYKVDVFVYFHLNITWGISLKRIERYNSFVYGPDEAEHGKWLVVGCGDSLHATSSSGMKFHSALPPCQMSFLSLSLAVCPSHMDMQIHFLSSKHGLITSTHLLFHPVPTVDCAFC